MYTVEQTYKAKYDAETIQRQLMDHRRSLSLLKITLWIGFATTFLMYLIFAFGFYVVDLMHIRTFIEQHPQNVLAINVFILMGFLMALALSLIKHNFYDAKSSFKYSIVITLVLCSLGVMLEVFNSTSQQDTIASFSAEKSRTFDAISNTSITLGSASNSNLLATLEGKLTELEGQKKPSKQKIDSLKAQIASLKATNAKEAETAKAAAGAAIETKSKSLINLKEENQKPVFKFMRDAFGISINMALVWVAIILVSGFEFCHALVPRLINDRMIMIENLEDSLNSLKAKFYAATGNNIKDHVFENRGTNSPTPSVNQSHAPVNNVRMSEANLGRTVNNPVPPDFKPTPATAKSDAPVIMAKAELNSPAPLFNSPEPIKMETEFKPSVEINNADSRYQTTGVGFLSRLTPPANRTATSEPSLTYRETLADRTAPIRDLPLDNLVNQSTLGQPSRTGQLGQPIKPELADQLGQPKLGQVELADLGQPNLAEIEQKANEAKAEKARLEAEQAKLAEEKAKLAAERIEALKAKLAAEAAQLKAREEVEKARLADEQAKLEQARLAEVKAKLEQEAKLEQAKLAEQARLAEEKAKLEQARLAEEKASLEAEQAKLSEAEKERFRLDELKGFSDEQITKAADAIKQAIELGQVKELGFNNLNEHIKSAGLPRSTEAIRNLIKLGCRKLEDTGLVILNPNYSRGKSLYLIA